MKPIAAMVIFPAALALLSGCAPGLGGGTYTRDQVRREQSVRMGVVESVREVQIEGTRSGVGPGAGAVIGGVAGSSVGHGRGAAVGYRKKPAYAMSMTVRYPCRPRRNNSRCRTTSTGSTMTNI